MNSKFQLPPTHEFTLDNGLRVIFIRDYEQEGFYIALQLPFGRFSEPPGYEGVAEITSGLIQKGTTQLTSEQFSEKLENTGASLFSEVGEEHFVAGMRMLSKFTSELIPLLKEMVSAPRFDSKEFARIQKEILTSIQAESVDPTIIANRHFYAELVGKDHPAGRFHTVNSVKNIKLDDVKSFYKHHFSPVNGLLMIAGDFDETFMRGLLDKTFGAWNAGAPTPAVIADLVSTDSNSIIRLIDKPDTTQTTLIMGHAAAGENNGDRISIALANYILGSGNFSSRLMTKIRSAEGRTYGIVSQIVAETNFGSFLISTTTQSQQLESVIKAIRKEFRDFCCAGVTEKELQAAKNFAVGNMAFQLEGIGNVAEKILWLRFYGRNNDYIENFSATVNAITVESINKIINRYFSEERLITVAVGNKKEIAGSLKQFGSPKVFHFRSGVYDAR